MEKRKYIRVKPLRSSMTTCGTCNKEFKVYPSQLLNGEGKHCSRKCQHLSQIDKPHPNIRRKMTPEEIERRKMLLSKRVSARKGAKQSLETRIKISALQQGITVAEWKGFKRSEDYLQRRKFRDQMQKIVFKRDGYKCQFCGDKENLQVDHIQPWSEYIELRFSLDNCRTLCAKCHYQITFGKPMPESVKAWGHNLGRRVQK